ncbi:MAG: RluA family pseudouridine synthase [Acidobacteria bacterium]|nr:MAG: RluA family pseudouridine synthase [Acidobacteriota bacterium]PYS12121.1 MAG: RluA family pseudouridine synthase [Acidobacteriota bacterium]
MKLQARPDDRGLRLDVFLARHVETLTRSQIQLLNRSGAIRIDGRQDKAGYRIRGGETVELEFHVLEPAPISAEQIPLQIYFEDQNLAVIEKPAGVVVHPGSGIRNGTIANALLFHFKNLSDVGGESRPGIVHRLDKKTSGLLIVAKNNIAHARLSAAFQGREVQKTYLALVHGRPARDVAAIDLAVGRHPRIRTKMAAGQLRGRAAFTEYKVLEYFRGFSLLEVKIKTGRTHQIRVHLSAIGNPVAGDDVYGERTYKQFVRKFGPFDRYFLHAAGLRFNHPSTKQPMAFQSPLPPELQKLLESIKS